MLSGLYHGDIGRGAATSVAQAGRLHHKGLDEKEKEQD
jgi:hypothetical protein